MTGAVFSLRRAQHEFEHQLQFALALWRDTTATEFRRRFADPLNHSLADLQATSDRLDEALDEAEAA